jgi:hypothetical protein
LFFSYPKLKGIGDDIAMLPSQSSEEVKELKLLASCSKKLEEYFSHLCYKTLKLHVDKALDKEFTSLQCTERMRWTFGPVIATLNKPTAPKKGQMN